MVFSSLVFIFVFLAAFFLLYFAINSRTWRNLVLLAASLFFYAWGEPLYVVLMLACILVNYFFALLISREKNKKLVLIIIVALNIVTIGFFKYGNFIADAVNSAFSVNISLPPIPLPIGISFYTFQALSYIIDVYRGDVKVQRNPLFLGAYIMAFPQLIAGPIVRYQTIEDELVNRRENIPIAALGARRFIVGLAKKVIIANSMGLLCDTIFDFPPAQFKFLGAFTAIIAYTLQIYFDFSGYSDMAIGMGKILGFNFLENFNYPYTATSITDFWRRWHISLSTFFRDYIYIPIGGNRVAIPRWIANMLVVWFLTGLWHGAGWTFIIWGLYYGALLILEKLLLSRILKKLNKGFLHLYTMFFVILGWAIFRIEDFSLLLDFIKSLFGGYGLGSVDFFMVTQIFQAKYLIFLVVGVVAATPFAKNLYSKVAHISYAQILRDAALILLFLLSVFMLMVSSYNPFIYFKF